MPLYYNIDQTMHKLCLCKRPIGLDHTGMPVEEEMLH